MGGLEKRLIHPWWLVWREAFLLHAKLGNGSGLQDHLPIMWKAQQNISFCLKLTQLPLWKHCLTMLLYGDPSFFRFYRCNVFVLAHGHIHSLAHIQNNNGSAIFWLSRYSNTEIVISVLLWKQWGDGGVASAALWHALWPISVIYFSPETLLHWPRPIYLLLVRPCGAGKTDNSKSNVFKLGCL